MPLLSHPGEIAAQIRHALQDWRLDAEHCRRGAVVLQRRDQVARLVYG